MCHRRLPIAIALATGLAGVWCGKSPSPLPQVQTGALRVVAMDTMAVNTIHVNLDDVDLGQQENPARLDQIVIGTHKLFVYTPASAGTTKTVEVKKNSLTTVWFWLATTGPYVGNIAPLFTVQDVTGAELSLEEQKGKVVLLIFFEHT
jgi:hypothetical protein